MKFIKQFLIILLFTFIGEIFNHLLPFPIPGNIYGMVLLFIFLMNGYIKICYIKETAKFLIDIMPILFIPSAVGIMTKIDELKSLWWQIIVITIISTIIVMISSGLTTQKILRKNSKEDITDQGRKSS